MGIIATIVSFYAIQFRMKIGLDDTLDVWGLHGMGGLTGLILTGVFACPEISSFTGAIYGNYAQLIPQLIGAIVTILFSFIVTYVILKLITVCTF